MPSRGNSRKAKTANPLRRALPALAAAFLAAGTAAAGTGPALAQDAEAGQAAYKKHKCRTCHGPTGKGLASYPRINGHPAGYVADRLERYRAGEKFGNNTALMAPRAKKLSDEEIADIGAFLESITP